MDNKILIKFFQDSLPNFDGKFCIAGGSMLSLWLDKPINDIDLFFENENEFLKCLKYFNEVVGECDYETPNAVRFVHKGMKYDLIRKEFGTPNEIISNFDFYNCAIAVTKDNVYALSHTLESINTNSLMLIGENYKINPTSTMKRVVKYAKKGFNVDNKILLTILSEIRIQTEESFMNSFGENSSFDF